MKSRFVFIALFVFLFLGFVFSANLENKYYLKYKSKVGLGESQTIYLYDYNDNPLVTDLELIYNDEVFLLKSDLGVINYIPKNLGIYYLDVTKYGLKGNFEVLDNYMSDEEDYVVFEGKIILNEVFDSNLIYYLIPSITLFLIVLIIFIVYFKRKFKSYDFTINKDYLKSRFLKQNN